VFPPISTADWTQENLVERIAEVRQLYLDTLASWPRDQLPEVPLYKRGADAPEESPVASLAPEDPIARDGRP
jgi:putative phosphoserine phosphatase/1-acylglycerol-3-phosphate O-acyltransferase